MTKKIQKLSSTEQDILSSLQAGSGLQRAFAPLIKRVMEVALQGEFETHIDKKEPE